MITQSVNEEAELWFDDIRIRAMKLNGLPSGSVVANGGFILPSTGIMISTIGISENIITFLESVSEKLSVDPMILYQAICDSLENCYNATIPIEQPTE